MKVFGTGLQRTGTMSLTKMLNEVGVKTLQFPAALFEDIRHPIAQQYDGFTDFPVPLLYRQLDEAYPDSKFIHMFRNEEDWLQSVEWLFSVGAVKFNWNRNPIFDQLHERFYGRRTFEKNTFLERYRTYNQEVLEYFENRQGAFLLVDLGKASVAQEICDFLGLDAPEATFPRLNRKEATTTVLARKLRRLLGGK